MCVIRLRRIVRAFVCRVVRMRSRGFTLSAHLKKLMRAEAQTNRRKRFRLLKANVKGRQGHGTKVMNDLCVERPLDITPRMDSLEAGRFLLG